MSEEAKADFMEGGGAAAPPATEVPAAPATKAVDAVGSTMSSKVCFVFRAADCGSNSPESYSFDGCGVAYRAIHMYSRALGLRTSVDSGNTEILVN